MNMRGVTLGWHFSASESAKVFTCLGPARLARPSLDSAPTLSGSAYAQATVSRGGRVQPRDSALATHRDCQCGTVELQCVLPAAAAASRHAVTAAATARAHLPRSRPPGRAGLDGGIQLASDLNRTVRPRARCRGLHCCGISSPPRDSARS
jgi:hypothetical protein